MDVPWLFWCLFQGSSSQGRHFCTFFKFWNEYVRFARNILGTHPLLDLASPTLTICFQTINTYLMFRSYIILYPMKGYAYWIHSVSVHNCNNIHRDKHSFNLSTCNTVLSYFWQTYIYSQSFPFITKDIYSDAYQTTYLLM